MALRVALLWVRGFQNQVTFLLSDEQSNALVAAVKRRNGAVLEFSHGPAGRGWASYAWEDIVGINILASASDAEMDAWTGGLGDDDTAGGTVQ